MSKSKRIKNDNSSSGVAKSLLSEFVRDILQSGMTEGYKDDYLNLGNK